MFSFLLCGFLVATAALIVSQQLRMIRTSRLTWEELVAAIKPVDMSGVFSVAQECNHPLFQPFRNSAADRWTMMGGSDGLRKMWSNATILLALAAYAEQWNIEESRSTSITMRSDGLALKRTILWIAISHFTFGLVGVRDTYVQMAAKSYLSMTKHLTELYRNVCSVRFAALDSSIWLY